MLLPALNKAKETAKEALCTANLRQMYLSYYNYSDQNNDYMLCITTDESTNYWYIVLGEDLKTQEKKVSVMTCPSHDKPTAGSFRYSFGMNGYYMPFSPTSRKLADKTNLPGLPRKLASQKYPTKTMLFTEVPRNSQYATSAKASSVATVNKGTEFRHNRKANALMVSGSVEKVYCANAATGTSIIFSSLRNGKNKTLLHSVIGQKDAIQFFPRTGWTQWTGWTMRKTAVRREITG